MSCWSILIHVDPYWSMLIHFEGGWGWWVPCGAYNRTDPIIKESPQKYKGNLDILVLFNFCLILLLENYVYHFVWSRRVFWYPYWHNLWYFMSCGICHKMSEIPFYDILWQMPHAPACNAFLKPVILFARSKPAPEIDSLCLLFKLLVSPPLTQEFSLSCFFLFPLDSCIIFLRVSPLYDILCKIQITKIQGANFKCQFASGN